MDILKRQFNIYQRSGDSPEKPPPQTFCFGRFEPIEDLDYNWSIVEFIPNQKKDMEPLIEEELFTTENGHQLWRMGSDWKFKVKNFTSANEIKPASSMDTQMARMKQAINDMPNELQFWQNKYCVDKPLPHKVSITRIPDNTKTPDVTLFEYTSIHGCPGSGKSTLIMNLIKRIHKDYKCLVVGPSHNVVANFAEKLKASVPSPKFSILSEESKIPAHLTRFHNSNHPDYNEKNKNAILSDVDVTLSTVNKNIKGVRRAMIDVLIVDEATRVPVIDFFTLVQKMTSLKAIILAGDPNQMGARINDVDAEDILRFAHRMKLGPVWHLFNQYRFGPHANLMLSKIFYKDQMQAVHDKRESSIGFIKLRSCTCTPGVNLGCSSEAKQVWKMLKAYRDEGHQSDILVVTPYKAQLARLKAILPKKGVVVKTLDTIQGDEYDNVIISLGRHEGSGFLTRRRINVSLSRARFYTIVIGHSKAIDACESLRRISVMAKKAGASATVDL